MFRLITAVVLIVGSLSLNSFADDDVTGTWALKSMSCAKTKTDANDYVSSDKIVFSSGAAQETLSILRPVKCKYTILYKVSGGTLEKNSVSAVSEDSASKYKDSWDCKYEERYLTSSFNFRLKGEDLQMADAKSDCTYHYSRVK